MLKIRELLACGVAVIACIAIAFSVITHLRNKALVSSLELATANNERLVSVNEQNSKSITDLINQRQIDDKIIKRVFEQYATLKANSERVYDQLEELKRNDDELKDLLSIRHPVSVNSLLNERAYSNSDGNSLPDPAP